MKKAEKKEQLKRMVREFFQVKDPVALTKLRNDIYNEIFRLPMSPNDKNILEDEMYLWNYNSDKYISNLKDDNARLKVVSDFDKMLQNVDNSLLGN
jgi:hypothetical protein